MCNFCICQSLLLIFITFFYYLIDNKTIPKCIMKIIIIFYLKSIYVMQFSEIILDIALTINYLKRLK